MRRYLPLIVLILIGAAIAGWQLARTKAPGATSLLSPAKPLQPDPPYLVAANQFMQDWAAGKTADAYKLLSPAMQKMGSQADMTKMLGEIKFGEPQPVAKVGTAREAYVIYSLKAASPAAGERPLAGYSLLLVMVQGGWRVAFMSAEEKVAEKYEDLRLSPAKDGGYVVTYNNEKGQVATVTLPAM